MEVQRKNSKKRQAILESLRSVTDHPTAEMIYNRLKPEYPDLSLGTVYRNLAMFKREGLITSVGVVDGLERFDFNVTPHAHFVCERCHAVIDVDLSPPEGLCEQVTCGRVGSCTLSFSGICNHCIRTDAEQ